MTSVAPGSARSVSCSLKFVKHEVAELLSVAASRQGGYEVVVAAEAVETDAALVVN